MRIVNLQFEGTEYTSRDQCSKVRAISCGLTLLQVALSIGAVGTPVWIIATCRTGPDGREAGDEAELDEPENDHPDVQG